jgi:hypothetical protein
MLLSLLPSLHVTAITSIRSYGAANCCGSPADVLR